MFKVTVKWHPRAHMGHVTILPESESTMLPVLFRGTKSACDRFKSFLDTCYEGLAVQSKEK